MRPRAPVRYRPCTVFLVLLITTFLPALPGKAQPGSQRLGQQEWGDQRDGTYANPILPADFSDLDAIRVGNRYYAISSTLQYAPGMAVLESYDLVNWHTVGHVVADIAALSPDLNWDRMNRAGRGIWAGAIRFHAGEYWVYFGTPDEGIFLSTATHASGPWSPPELVLSSAGWDDPCPFWDDDGQGYLITTHFKDEPPRGNAYNIHLFKLRADGKQFLKGSDRIIHQSQGSEANKLYKIHGLYFHYYSEVSPEGRVPMMERAKNLDGPWETKQLMHVRAAVDKEPNQGGLIELPSGAWYFLSHQGTGDWEGRAAVLLPVTWIDGWPIPGKAGPDGIGNMVWHERKPISGYPLQSVVAGDGFSAHTLRPEWEWNYQPRKDMWSLDERPGFLRLHAFPALCAGDFHAIGNVLTQRSMRTSRSVVTVKLDLAGMVDGQQAGLSHYARHFATLGVVQRGSDHVLTYNHDGAVESGPIVPGPTLWIRSTWGFDGKSRFAYSFDGRVFPSFGGSFRLQWGDYRGDRIGIFTVNSKEAGYLDVDEFRYQAAR